MDWIEFVLRWDWDLSFDYDRIETKLGFGNFVFLEMDNDLSIQTELNVRLPKKFLILYTLL